MGLMKCLWCLSLDSREKDFVVAILSNFYMDDLVFSKALAAA